MQSFIIDVLKKEIRETGGAIINGMNKHLWSGFCGHGGEQTLARARGLEMHENKSCMFVIVSEKYRELEKFIMIW